MLYHFTTPRSRDWQKYMKKLIKFLEKKEETSHLAAFVRKCQQNRSVLIKLLEECAREKSSRPDDMIKTLEKYLPTLEQLIEGIEANNIKLRGVLEIVWTSFLSGNVNAKSLSYDLRWEKCSCYLLLGLAHYQKAIELHHMNRQNAQEMRQNNASDIVEFDPIFDDPEENKTSAVIYDDKSTVKEISVNLRKASAIWNYVSNNCYPLIMNENAFALIPETFSHSASALSKIAATNAQEFMIQLAVQTSKSQRLTAKLSMGASDKFRECNKILSVNLSNVVYEDIRIDLRLYLSARSSLYRSIAFKYEGKLLQKAEEHGKCIAFFQESNRILSRINLPVNKKKSNSDSKTLVIMKKSVAKQLQAVSKLLDYAKSENENVYFEVVPKLNTVSPPESKFVIKTENYTPVWNAL